MENQVVTSTFYTSYGEIRCVRGSGNCTFAFFNPRATQKGEMVAFINTFKCLANFLPNAQSVAKEYIAMMEGIPLPQSSREQQAGLSEEEAFSLTKQTEDTMIYSKILFVFGREPVIRVVLEVDVFEGKPCIWLKRYWYNKKDEATGTEASWIPCFGAFQLSLVDNAKDMFDFADKNISLSRLENESVFHAMMDAKMNQAAVAAPAAARKQPVEQKQPTNDGAAPAEAKDEEEDSGFEDDSTQA